MTAPTTLADLERAATPGPCPLCGALPCDQVNDPSGLDGYSDQYGRNYHIDATEIWENLADILRDDPPTELTEEVCARLAERLNSVIEQPPATTEAETLRAENARLREALDAKGDR